MVPLFVLSFLCLGARARLGRHAQIVGRDVNLQPEYDFVIVGGGTSGLTVADRLTEDADVSVLVVEFGPLDRGQPAVLVPGLAGTAYTEYSFNLTSEPMRGLADRPYGITAAGVVGGGTIVNGMFFDRGGAPDYDDWEKLGNPGWGWGRLLPYFIKACRSETFTPNNESFAKEFNMSWDLSVHGSEGPVHSSYPPFMYESIKNFFHGWTSLGVPIPADPGAGVKAGVFWAPSSKDPRNQTRSSARTAHHNRAAPRPNYHLLTMHAATKILFNETAATGVEYISRESGGTGSVTAGKEVILAAGTVHTTQLLQLSGIGPADLLRSLDVDVLVNLPVGYNLQDHPTLYSSWSFANEPIPNAAYFASNATYQEESLARYYSSHDGPYTISRGATVCFLPLRNLTDGETFTEITSLARSTNTSTVYPTLSNVPASVQRGYAAQRDVLISTYSSLDTSVKESSYLGGGTMSIVMLKPLSRGTIFAHTTDALAPPLVDYGAMLAPSDMRIMIAAVRRARDFMATPAMSGAGGLGPITELLPGANLTTDAQLDASLRASLSPTFAHVCCTAPMMPRRLGGVLDPRLRVYGVERLRVVDASAMPLLPATHTSSTVYAIAEKAADLIRQAYS